MVSFRLDRDKTSGSRLDLMEVSRQKFFVVLRWMHTCQNDSRGPLLGLVVGRDSTSSNIGVGNFKYHLRILPHFLFWRFVSYLYLDPTASPGSPWELLLIALDIWFTLVASPGSTPQSVPSYFATSSGLNKQAETSVVRSLWLVFHMQVIDYFYSGVSISPVVRFPRNGSTPIGVSWTVIMKAPEPLIQTSCQVLLRPCFSRSLITCTLEEMRTPSILDTRLRSP